MTGSGPATEGAASLPEGAPKAGEAPAEGAPKAGEAPAVWLCIDSTDPVELARFWGEALGYTVASPLSGGTYLYLKGPRPDCPVVYLQKVPETKLVKNRLHLDLRTPEPEALIQRLERLGAIRLGEPNQGKTCEWWQVMADPEGNEFCVCALGTGAG